MQRKRVDDGRVGPDCDGDEFGAVGGWTRGDVDAAADDLDEHPGAVVEMHPPLHPQHPGGSDDVNSSTAARWIGSVDVHDHDS